MMTERYHHQLYLSKYNTFGNEEILENLSSLDFQKDWFECLMTTYPSKKTNNIIVRLEVFLIYEG